MIDIKTFKLLLISLRGVLDAKDYLVSGKRGSASSGTFTTFLLRGFRLAPVIPEYLSQSFLLFLF